MAHVWSTVDAIFILRLLADIHREFERPLNVAYLDIKATFDSVDCTTLWKVLRSRGFPDDVLQLIEALHQNTQARVGVGQGPTDRFDITSGVTQGCILAPALFSVAIDWIFLNTWHTTKVLMWGSLLSLTWCMPIITIIIIINSFG